MADPAADAAMEGEMEGEMDDMEGMEGDENAMDEDEEGDDGRTDNFSEVHVETFRAHYDIKIRNFCQAINEKVIDKYRKFARCHM